MAKYLFMAFAIFIVSVTTSVAHQGATGIVKERMDAMSDMSDRSKQLQTALDDQVSDKKLRKAFLTVARSCKSCHKTYRRKK